MKKIIYICALAPLLGACASAQVDNCNGWAKTATVDYGDGGISVTKKKTVKKQKPFVIKLSPDSDDWKDKKVIVKANTKDPSICPNESWLNGDDSYNKRNKFKYCAPLVPEDTTCVYKYSVEVVDADGNTLLFVDPRVHVTF